MKKAILILAVVLFASTNLCAMTIDAVAKHDTVYHYPLWISKTFGKLPSSGEYGIFLNIECKHDDGESDHNSLFYRLNSGITQDGKFLHTVIDGKKIILAEKKWLGWKTADGVKIGHSVKKENYRIFKVWVEIQ